MNKGDFKVLCNYIRSRSGLYLRTTNYDITDSGSVERINLKPGVMNVN